MQLVHEKIDALELETSFDAFHRASSVKLTRLVLWAAAVLIYIMAAMSLTEHAAAVPDWYVTFAAFIFAPSMLVSALLLRQPRFEYLSRPLYVLACLQGWLGTIALVQSFAWSQGRPLYIESIYLILVSIYFFSPLRLFQALWLGILPSLLTAAVILHEANSFAESAYSLSFIFAFNVIGMAARYATEGHMHRIYELNQRLLGLASKDPLTQLPNRRGFDHHLLSLGHRNEHGHNEGYAFIVFDLDNFKHYNDQHGHPIGDQLLGAMGNRLLQLTNNNSGAFVARFGGDEFAGLWQCDSEAEAKVLAQQLRAKLKAVISEDATQHPSRLDLSVGVAWQPGSRQINLSRLYELSDRALYEAKVAAKRDRQISDKADMAATSEQLKPDTNKPARTSC